MKISTKQRIIAFLLTFAMIFQQMPVSTLAAGRKAEPASDTVTIQAEDPVVTAAATTGTVNVTLVGNDGNTSTGTIPIGKTDQITSDNAPVWDGYIYDADSETGITVDNLKVYEFAIDDEGKVYFSTASDQFAAIELGDKQVKVPYRVAEPIDVQYQIKIGNNTYTLENPKKANNFFDIIGPDVAKENGEFKFNVVLQSGVNFLEDNWIVKNGDTTLTGDAKGTFSVERAQVTEVDNTKKIIVQIVAEKKDDEQEIIFRGANSALLIKTGDGNNGSNKPGDKNNNEASWNRKSRLPNGADGAFSADEAANRGGAWGAGTYKYHSSDDDQPLTVYYHAGKQNIELGLMSYLQYDLNPADWNHYPNGKVLNKVTIQIGDGDDMIVPETKLTIPAQSTGNKATTNLGNGITAELECVWGTANNWPRWYLRISTKDDRELYGKIYLSTNFKTDTEAEVWVNELVGIKEDNDHNPELKAEGTQDIKYYYEGGGRQGYWINGGWIQAAEDSLTNHLTPNGKEYIRREGDSTVTIYGEIADGYSTDKSDYEVILKKSDVDYHLEKDEGSPCTWDIRDGKVYTYIPSSETSKDIRITIRATRRYQVEYDLNNGSWKNGVAPDATTYLTEAKGLKPGTTVTLINSDFEPIREGYEFDGWELEKAPLTGFMYGNGETFTITSGDPVADLPVTYDGQNNVYQFKLKAVWAGEATDQTAPYTVKVKFTDAAGNEYKTSFRENGLINKKAYILMSSLQEKITNLIDKDTSFGFENKDDVKQLWPDFFKATENQKYSVYVTEDGSAELNLEYIAVAPEKELDNKTVTYNGDVQKNETTGEITVTINGHNYTIKDATITAEGTNADETSYKPTITKGDNYKVVTTVDGKEVDVTNFFKNLEINGGELTINKAELTVTAEDKSKTKNASDPPLTYRVSGLKGDDTEGDIISGGSVSRTKSSEHNNDEDEGTYEKVLNATVILTEKGETNYTVKYIPGDFTISDVQYSTFTLTEEIKNGTVGENGKVTYDTVEETPTFTFTLTGVEAYDENNLPTDVTIVSLEDGTLTFTTTAGDHTLPVKWAENAEPVLTRTSIPLSN